MINDIPVVILAGGFGTRLSEETDSKPKPMVKIGNQPILWHIMSIYAIQGFNNFIVATGYKHEIIKDWVDSSVYNKSWGFECHVSVTYTGEKTQTGGRIKQCIEGFSSDLFLATYGDGLANVNLKNAIKIHTAVNNPATVTAVRPPARFGYLEIDNNKVTSFGEKKQADVGWINGGFFVFKKEVAKYISGDSDPLETGALPTLAQEGKLNSYLHHGFWKPMDTLREKHELEEYVLTGELPWLNFKENRE